MKTEQESASVNEDLSVTLSHNPEAINSRKAAARLKQKQAQLDIVKRRLMVLKGQEDYSRYRTMDQERRINHHNSLHQNIAKERTSLEKQLSQMRKKQLQEQKFKHDKLQKELRQNADKMSDSLLASRINDTREIKEQQIRNERVIEENKRKDLSEKVKIKDTILADESRKKSRISQYKNSRIRETQGNRSMDVSRYSEIVSAKDKEIERMMRKQQEMLKKASESIAIQKSMQSEYGKVFVEVKEKNHIKFPSISNAHKKTIPGTGATGTGSSSYRSENVSNVSRGLSLYEMV